MPRQVLFPEFRNVVINAVSSVNPPSYQTKSLIWTLQGAFEEYNKRGQYSSASLTTRVGDHPLGFVSIRSTLTDSQAIDPLLRSSQLAPRRRGLTIRLDYTPNGAIFTDRGFFNTVIGMLAYIANGDPKSGVMVGFSLYNTDEDYSISVQPMSQDAAEELPLVMMIRILGGLPEVMYEEQRGGRWAELRGLVKQDGVNVGRVIIQRGSSQVEEVV